MNFNYILYLIYVSMKAAWHWTALGLEHFVIVMVAIEIVLSILVVVERSCNNVNGLSGWPVNKDLYLLSNINWNNNLN